MADDAFDPNALLDTENEGDFNRYMTPVPAGEHYARVKEGSLKVRKFTSKAGNPVAMCDLQWVVEDASVAEGMGVKEAVIFDSFFLDIDHDTNRLVTKEENPNANLTLGRLKFAMGVKEGRPWSLRSFEGMACYLKVDVESAADDVENMRNKVLGYYKDRKADGADAQRKRR